jgi:hypothetical protein
MIHPMLPESAATDARREREEDATRRQFAAEDAGDFGPDAE